MPDKKIENLSELQLEKKFLQTASSKISVPYEKFFNLLSSYNNTDLENIGNQSLVEIVALCNSLSEKYNQIEDSDELAFVIGQKNKVNEDLRKLELLLEQSNYVKAYSAMNKSFEVFFKHPLCGIIQFILPYHDELDANLQLVIRKYREALVAKQKLDDLQLTHIVADDIKKFDYLRLQLEQVTSMIKTFWNQSPTFQSYKEEMKGSDIVAVKQCVLDLFEQALFIKLAFLKDGACLLGSERAKEISDLFDGLTNLRAHLETLSATNTDFSKFEIFITANLIQNKFEKMKTWMQRNFDAANERIDGAYALFEENRTVLSQFLQDLKTITAEDLQALRKMTPSEYHTALVNKVKQFAAICRSNPSLFDSHIVSFAESLENRVVKLKDADLTKFIQRMDKRIEGIKKIAVKNVSPETIKAFNQKIDSFKAIHFDTGELKEWINIQTIYREMLVESERRWSKLETQFTEMNEKVPSVLRWDDFDYIDLNKQRVELKGHIESIRENIPKLKRQRVINQNEIDLVTMSVANCERDVKPFIALATRVERRYESALSETMGYKQQLESERKHLNQCTTMLQEFTQKLMQLRSSVGSTELAELNPLNRAVELAEQRIKSFNEELSRLEKAHIIQASFFNELTTDIRELREQLSRALQPDRRLQSLIDYQEKVNKSQNEIEQKLVEFLRLFQTAKALPSADWGAKPEREYIKVLYEMAEVAVAALNTPDISLNRERTEPIIRSIQAKLLIHRKSDATTWSGAISGVQNAAKQKLASLWTPVDFAAVARNPNLFSKATVLITSIEQLDEVSSLLNQSRPQELDALLESIIVCKQFVAALMEEKQSCEALMSEAKEHHLDAHCSEFLAIIGRIDIRLQSLAHFIQKAEQCAPADFSDIAQELARNITEEKTQLEVVKKQKAGIVGVMRKAIKSHKTQVERFEKILKKRVEFSSELARLSSILKVHSLPQEVSDTRATNMTAFLKTALRQDLEIKSFERLNQLSMSQEEWMSCLVQDLNNRRLGYEFPSSVSPNNPYYSEVKALNDQVREFIEFASIKYAEMKQNPSAEQQFDLRKDKLNTTIHRVQEKIELEKNYAQQIEKFCRCAKIFDENFKPVLGVYEYLFKKIKEYGIGYMQSKALAIELFPFQPPPDLERQHPDLCKLNALYSSLESSRLNYIDQAKEYIGLHHTHVESSVCETMRSEAIQICLKQVHELKLTEEPSTKWWRALLIKFKNLIKSLNIKTPNLGKSWPFFDKKRARPDEVPADADAILSEFGERLKKTKI